MVKQLTSRKLHRRGGAPFWQERYYDFNVWSAEKEAEKLDYIHHNPVKRGLVEHPEDWAWSSARHYLTGEECGVEIESHWTAGKRERRESIRQFGNGRRVEFRALPRTP
jgi:putative transposase